MGEALIAKEAVTLQLSWHPPKGKESIIEQASPPPSLKLDLTPLLLSPWRGGGFHHCVMPVWGNVYATWMLHVHQINSISLLNTKKKQSHSFPGCWYWAKLQFWNCSSKVRFECTVGLFSLTTPRSGLEPLYYCLLQPSKVSGGWGWGGRAALHSLAAALESLLLQGILGWNNTHVGLRLVTFCSNSSVSGVLGIAFLFYSTLVLRLTICQMDWFANEKQIFLISLFSPQGSINTLLI